MFKKVTCLLLIVFLTFSFCISINAGPRFPQKPDNYVADEANVFDSDFIKELNSFNEKIKTKANINFYLASLRFTDGVPIDSYTNDLFKQWALTDKDYLIVMSIGNESYYALGGDYVAKRISSSLFNSLFVSSGFSNEFNKENYGTAVSMLFSDLSSLVAKQFNIDTKANSFYDKGTYKPDYSQITKGMQELDFHSIKKKDNDRNSAISGMVFIILLIFYIISRFKKGFKTGCFSFFVIWFILYLILR